MYANFRSFVLLFTRLARIQITLASCESANLRCCKESIGIVVVVVVVVFGSKTTN